MTRSSPDLSTLTVSERLILRLKALIGPATNKTVFLECLNRLRFASLPGNNKSLTPVLNTLRARGYLNEELACVPDLLHPLAVEALAAPEGEVMVEAIRAGLKPTTGYHWNIAVIETDTRRWTRLAVYLNDEEGFARMVEARSRFLRSPSDIFDVSFAHVPLGIDWFATRTPAFQVALLTAKADRLIVSGEAAPDYSELIEYCRQTPPLRGACWPMIADAEVMGGRLSRLAAEIASPPEGIQADMPVAFAAVHALLTGDVTRAVERFTEARILHRKATRKRKGGLPGYIGLLHLCALIAADDASHHAEIEAALDTKQPTLGLTAIRALLELARNREPAAREAVQTGLASIEMMGNPPPFSSALVAVAAFQVDQTLARRAIKQFAPLFRRTETSMPLVAGMVAEVLAALGDHPAPYQAFLAAPGREVAFRFTRLIGSKPPWERALESLEAMLAPAPDPSVKNKRLVWKIDPGTGTIEPQEQTLQAKGWSAGRAVSLKRLHQGDPKLDYLDAADWRAARTIRRSTEGWGGYEVLEVRPAETLPALVGHPRLFDRRGGAQPVELIEGRAELVLSSVKTGFRLAVSHVATAPDVAIEEETPTRWRVVVIDAKAVEAAGILGANGVTVPKDARDRLAALARLQMPSVPLRIDTVEIGDVATCDGDPAPVVRLSPLGEGLKAELVVRPLGADGPYFRPGLGGRIVSAGPTRARRDFAAEQQAARALIESCPSLGGDGPEWEFDDPQAGLELLSELQSLPAPPKLEWPEGVTLALRGIASAQRFKASVKGSEGWFTLGGTIEVDQDLVLDLKDLLARLDRAQGRFIPLDTGGFLALDRHFRQQLERLRRLGDGLKIPTVAGGTVRGLLEEAGALKADSRWKAFVGRLDESNAWQPRLPAGFTAELRDYQRDGFVWMSRLARWGAGALLADDMGLGKTVQAIAVMLSRAAEGPCLVVAPTSVCGNWETELARFAPTLTVRRLAEAGDRGETTRTLGPGEVLIATYGLLAREEEALAAVPWAMAVLDEAQAIKNADTQRAKASQSLQAGFRLALTGTPVENDLDELWSLFRFINPGLLGSRERFGRRFATPIGRDGDAEARAALKALVRPFLLRRTKTTVLAELPPRTEQTLLIEMDETERAFYEALRQGALERLTDNDGERTRIHILAEITKLRRACCHPTLAAAGAEVPSAKLDAFLDLVAELRDGRHRALVFSQFVGHLDKVRTALDTAGYQYQYLDGSTPARERERRVTAFQAGEGDLFLISLKAGGFGLNLTAADYVIHLDPWWNPAVEDQASDRAHRIGQQRPVTIYRLIVKDSIEEGILALHRRKRDLADALLDEADSSGRLSEEDLLRLIRGDELP